MGKNSHKSFFIPFFCGSSRKDVADLPNSSPETSWTGKTNKKSTPITTHENDDNNNNNRFVSHSTHEKSFGLSKRHNLFSLKNLVTTPMDATHIKNPLGHSNRYTKYHHPHNNLVLGGGKNIVSPATELTTTSTISNSSNNVKFGVMGRSKSHNERRIMTSVRSRRKKYYKTSSDDHDMVMVSRVEVTRESDPLPVVVVKCPRHRDQQVDVNNLSKRRGIQIKTLQIQPNS